MIRPAKPGDLQAMLEIYAPYVLHTAVSFEYEVPSLEVFTARYTEITRAFPWLVWEEDDVILGYAYAHKAFSRAAYAWDAELSVYVRETSHGQGIGRALYTKLEAILKALGYCNLYGLVSQENEGSCRFHEEMGYRLMGVLPDTGYKFGTWHSLCYYGKRIGEIDRQGSLPRAYAEEV